MTRREYKKRAKIFKALAHPVRLQILARLSQGSFCVCDLIPHLDQRQAYISQQLMILRKNHLVNTLRDGKRVQYELAVPVLKDALESTLEEFLGDLELQKSNLSDVEDKYLKFGR